MSTASSRPQASRRLLAVASMALVALVAACSGASGAGSASGSPAPSGGIIREPLGSAQPATAPGQELGLWHYTIPAGSKLVPHHHPGWQVARIVSGTLTYTIIAGEVTVLRKGGASETHGADETIELVAGDTVVENPETDHFGANKGSVPVELYSSSLFQTGEPPAIPLASPSPS